jgi:tRNA(Ile)-lysidine synthase TilS/MesJ
MKKQLLTVTLGIGLAMGVALSAWAQKLGNEKPQDAFILALAPEPGEEEMAPDDFLLPGESLGPRPKGQMKNQKPGEGSGPLQQNGHIRQDKRQHYLDLIREKDPARYQRVLKIRELSDAYRQTKDKAKRESIEKELRPLLDAELKAQQADAKKKIALAEKRLEQIKAVLKQRDEHWNEVVDFNLKKITGQTDYLEFAPGPRPMGE